MPVTFTPLGDMLEATVIDDNLATWEALLRSGYLQADLVGRFNRYLLQRYTSGRLMLAKSHAYPHRDPTNATTSGIQETFDLTYRQALENARTWSVADVRLSTGARDAYAMELLGKPGPSFYYNWQEEGFNSPATYAAIGWPPSYWPISRYPDTFCYSRWLTVPGASLRIFLREPAVVRLHGSCLGSSTWYNMVRHLNLTRVVVPAAKPWSDANGQSNYSDRRYQAMQFALIVDTNPVLHDDEFSNGNGNILDPTTGAMAAFRSWQVLRTMTLAISNRARSHLYAEVALKGGGRWYNFRLAFRDSAVHGWLDHDTVPPTWRDTVWHDDLFSINSPNSGAYWPDNQLLHPHGPCVVNLWENTSLSAEVFYGRQTAYVYDQDNPEWTGMP